MPFSLAVMALFVGCGGGSGGDTAVLENWEGRFPGECDDGADNDGDGAYDCNDSDCDGAPDCAPDTGDSGPTGDTADTADTAAAAAAALQARRDAAWEALMEDVQEWFDHGYAVGLGVAVVLDGEVAYAVGEGVTQYGGGIPVDVDTVFRWNSVSKFHTALAVMQLVESGALDLEAPVTDLLPDLTLTGNQGSDVLTLHRLMTMTSALPDAWDTQCSGELESYWQFASPELMAESGTLFNYTNAAWSLTGRLIEEASGQPFIDYMQDQVLGPAGMASATFDVDEVVAGLNYTFGYDGDFYTPDIHDCPYLRPAGWLHGSVLDLASMAEVMLARGAGLVSTDSFDHIAGRMFTTGFSDDSAYGYGLYNFEYKGISLLGHNGAGAGHRSFVLFAPELGFAVVTASNNEYFDPFVVAERAFELFLDLDPDWEPPQTATDPDSWAEYVGTYEDPVNVGTIVVTLAEDQKLYARFVDGSDTERRLYQYANDEFFYLFNGYNYIRFARDPVSEEPRFFANRYFVGDRVGSDPEGPAPNPREQVRMIVGQGAERELRVPGLKTGPE